MGSIWDDIIGIGILLGFFILIYMRWKKKTFTEVWKELRDL